MKFSNARQNGTDDRQPKPAAVAGITGSASNRCASGDVGTVGMPAPDQELGSRCQNAAAAPRMQGGTPHSLAAQPAMLRAIGGGAATGLQVPYKEQISASELWPLVATSTTGKRAGLAAL